MLFGTGSLGLPGLLVLRPVRDSRLYRLLSFALVSGGGGILFTSRPAYSLSIHVFNSFSVGLRLWKTSKFKFSHYQASGSIRPSSAANVQS